MAFRETIHDAIAALIHARFILAKAPQRWDIGTDGKKKQPFLFRLKSGKLFSFAGLWEKWKKSESETFETFTILTTNANELIKPFHERMPVILNSKDFDQWLDPKTTDPKEVQPLLQPYPEKEIIFVAVNPMVNNPKNQGPQCVETLG